MICSDFRFNRITSCCVGHRLHEPGGSREATKEADATIQVREDGDSDQSGIRCAHSIHDSDRDG